MADNYLEKRYSQVFGRGSYVDPETGYEVSRAKVRRFPVRLSTKKTEDDKSSTNIKK